MENPFSQKHSRKKLITVIILLIAVSIFIAGVNKKHLSPFSTEVVCSDVMYNVKDAQSGAMVDRITQTVYFYNADDEIVAVTDMASEGNKINWITGLNIKDDEIQITGCLYEADGIYLSSESVQAFSRDGDWIREADRLDYDANAQISVPQWGVVEYSALVDNNNAGSITLTYSPWFLIKNLLYYLSIVFILAVVCWLLVKAIQKKLVKRYKGTVLIVGAILVTAVFFSINGFTGTLTMCKKTLALTSQQLSALIEDNIADDLDIIVKSGDIQAYMADASHQERIGRIQRTFTNFMNANKSDYNYFTMIYFLDPDNDPDDLLAEGNQYYVGLDSRGIVSTGTKVVIPKENESCISAGKDGEVYFLQEGINKVMFTYSIVRNASGKPIALVQVISLVSNILYNEAHTLESNLVNLLAIFILLYVLYILSGTFYKDFRSLRHREKSDKSGRALDMAGLYMFVFHIANIIDEVILVYVAQSLCENMDPALQAAMIALPLSANGAGRWIGTFLAGPVIRKFGERKTGILASFLAIGVMLCMAMSVQLDNIAILIVCKFLQGLLLSGFMYVISDTLPLNAANEKEKAQALNHSQMSKIGAEILAALAGGYISMYLGYELVYIGGAIVCGILLVLTILTFSRGSRTTAGEDPDVKKTGLKESWMVFFKKPMLIFLIFYLIPYTLLGGYKNYIFPLYTAGAGISVLLLSNISVYGMALTFVIDDVIKQYSMKVKPMISMVVPALIFAGGLMYFLICPNLLWAVIMYFGLSIVKRMSGVGQKLYISATAKDYGLDDKLVQSNFYTIESAAYVLQSPVLSTFMTLGMTIGSALVGAVSFIMVAVFGLFGRKNRRE